MPTNDPLALVVDFGTQSVRFGAVNLKGDIVALIKRPYDPVYISKGAGLAEQDPDFYWERFCECAQEFTEKYADLYENAVGITVTCFRDTTVLLDEDLRPIRPAIHWLDQRLARAERNRLPLLKRFLFKLVGMEQTLIFNRQRTVALWYQQNEPENWNKTYRYVSMPAYMNFKLSNNLSDGASGFTGHYPIDYKKREWYKNEKALKNIFEIPRSLLPDLTPTGGIIGEITEETSKVTGIPAGIKLYASGSDKSCESLGLGSLDSHIGCISYGTACTICATNKKYHEPEPFLPAYPSCIPGYYNMEVQIYRGYWMLSWFIKEFAKTDSDEAHLQHLVVEDVLNRKIVDIPPGSHGLVLQPFWGAGLSKPTARGSIIGFTDAHTKYHMYRAILEGIAYALRDGLEGIEKSQHQKITELRISGGGSQSDVICQITADIFGRPVSRVQTFETSTLGGAMALFIATKHFNSPEEAVTAMSHKTDVFTPNPEAREKYEYLYRKVYKKLYGKLRGMYGDIKDF